MTIHVVQQGKTLIQSRTVWCYSRRLIIDNEPPNPDNLVVGQV